MRPFLITSFFVLWLAIVHGQSRQTPKQYIERFDQDAVAEMLKSGVPASITLSQGMLESDYGNSHLAKKARNHFGIKCHSKWTGGKFYMDDDAKDECFRVYETVYDSYVDHSNFLRNNRRYGFLFDLKTTDYKGWAKGLKKAGYATNPKYPALLIKIIEENGLAKYDKMTKSDLKKLGATSKGSTGDPGTNGGVSGNQSGKGSQQKGKETKPNSLPSKTGIQISSNKIKYVVSRPGDTPDAIAKRYNMGLWQICHYNEVKRKMKFQTGTIIYLQPKRWKYRGGVEFHKVKSGDTIWKVSQKYGIKMRRLRAMNKLEKGAVIKVGQKLRLK